MAVEVMTWVFGHSQSKNGERLVMLAIADACNSPDGTGAWLSNAALSAKTNLSARAVQESVRRCELLGELKVERNAGRGGVNAFAVVIAEKVQILRGADSAGMTDDYPAESAGGPNGGGVAGQGEKGAESAPPSHQSGPAESAPGTVKNSSTKSSSEKTRATTSRGHRLPDDFHATPDMIEWARKNTPNVGAVETDAFVDWFRSAPGQKGVKTDWIATWRNWMRKEQKRIDEQRQRSEGYAKRNGQGGRFNGGMTAESNAPKAVPADEKCPKHPSYRAGTCGPCRSERVAKPASA